MPMLELRYLLRCNAMNLQNCHFLYSCSCNHMIILRMHVGTKGLNQQCAACSGSPRNVEWTALQATESLVLLYLNSVLLAYSWECVNTVNMPPPFCTVLWGKSGEVGGVCSNINFVSYIRPSHRSHTISQQLPGVSGWTAASMDAYYRNQWCLCWN